MFNRPLPGQRFISYPRGHCRRRGDLVGWPLTSPPPEEGQGEEQAEGAEEQAVADNAAEARKMPEAELAEQLRASLKILSRV